MNDLRVGLLEKYFDSVSDGLLILEGLFNVDRVEFVRNVNCYFMGLKFDLDNFKENEIEFIKYFDSIKLDCRNMVDSYISLKGLFCRDNVIGFKL